MYHFLWKLFSGLFNDAAGASDYIASNGRVIIEQWNGNNGCGLTCGILLEFADVLKKTANILSQGSLCYSLGLNQVTPECMREALPIEQVGKTL
jgi:hypothetical protein